MKAQHEVASPLPSEKAAIVAGAFKEKKIEEAGRVSAKDTPTCNKRSRLMRDDDENILEEEKKEIGQGIAESSGPAKRKKMKPEERLDDGKATEGNENDRNIADVEKEDRDTLVKRGKDGLGYVGELDVKDEQEQEASESGKKSRGKKEGGSENEGGSDSPKKMLRRGSARFSAKVAKLDNGVKKETEPQMVDSNGGEESGRTTPRRGHEQGVDIRQKREKARTRKIVAVGAESGLEEGGTPTMGEIEKIGRGESRQRRLRSSAS